MIRPPSPFRLPSPIFLSAVILLSLALPARASELLAHQANYRITFGIAEQATPIGQARQRLTNCNGNWKLERDVEASVVLTQTLRFDINSALRAEETQSGKAFSYSLRRAMNGENSRRDGKISLTRTGGRAVLNTPEGRQTLELPAETILPVELIPAAIERLKRGAEIFALETFDAEVISDNFLVKGSLIDPQELPPRFLKGIDSERVGARVWPLLLQFFRADRPTDPPLFQAKLRLHETGVISRMILTYGWINLGVDLVGFTALPADRC